MSYKVYINGEYFAKEDAKSVFLTMGFFTETVFLKECAPTPEKFSATRPILTVCGTLHARSLWKFP